MGNSFLIVGDICLYSGIQKGSIYQIFILKLTDNIISFNIVFVGINFAVIVLDKLIQQLI